MRRKGLWEDGRRDGSEAMPLAETPMGGLVNVPLGSTGFGLGFSSTAGTHINQGETTPGTPAETDGGTGLGQRSLDNQRLFVNGNLIDELTFGSEQIATFISTATDQFSADRGMSAAADGQAIESQLYAGLVCKLQHEPIREVAGHESFESEVSDNGTFVNDGSIVGIPNLDISLQATPQEAMAPLPISGSSIFRNSRFSRSSLKRTSSRFRRSRG